MFVMNDKMFTDAVLIILSEYSHGRNTVFKKTGRFSQIDSENRLVPAVAVCCDSFLPTHGLTGASSAVNDSPERR